MFGRTRARLRIGEVPNYLPLNGYIVLIPAILIVSFNPSSAKYNAALLGTDTEVAIAPKVRRTGSKTSKEESRPLTNGITSTTKQDSQRIKLRALPRAFFSLNSSAPQDRVAYVSPMSFCFLAKRRPPLNTTDGLSPIIVRLLKSPVDPLSTGEGQAATSEHQNSSKRAQPNGSTSGPSASSNTSNQIALRWSREVPDKHVVFEDPSVGVGDWDVWFVRFRLQSYSHR